LRWLVRADRSKLEAAHMIAVTDPKRVIGMLRFPDQVRHTEQSGTEAGEAVRRSAGIETVRTDIEPRA